MKHTLTLIAFLTAFSTQAQTIDNWVASNMPVRNSSNDCWRNGSWTPATAHPECDKDLKPQAKVTPVKQVVENKVVAPPIVVQSPPTFVQKEVIKVTHTDKTFFDFDKSVIKPEGKVTLDNLYNKVKDVKVEVVILVGHTDSVGSVQYNIKLGQRRAEAVKAYLISKGMDANLIKTSSKGKSDPIADNKTIQGRAANRRVEITINGTK